MKKVKSYRRKKSGAKSFKLKNRKDKYDNDWFRYSKRFLHHNPNCYACGQKAGHTDHIFTARHWPDKFDKLDNHMPLCIGCHSTVTALFEMQTPPDIEGKIAWINARRKEFNCSVRIKVLDRYGR